MRHLAGKVALVTGAAGKAGLGRAIALRLAAAGADLAVNDLDGEKQRAGLSAVVAEIEDLGARALPVFADITDAAQVDAMVEATLSHFGGLDILVNNAAAPPADDRALVVDLTEEAFAFIQKVNVIGTFLCCRAGARAMLQRDRGGRIINISSVAGETAIPRYAAYSASKFAVRGLTQALALELAPHVITVNAICPGLIATERLDIQAEVQAPANLSPAQYRQARIDSVTATSPFGRMTEAADVADLAVFLASDDAEFITGQSLTVDSGMHLS